MNKLSKKKSLSIKNICISNDYHLKKKKIKKFNLNLAYDTQKQYLYLNSPIEYKFLKPKQEWITYNEPEDHLRSLSNILKKLYPSKGLNIGCISFKDLPLANYFNRKNDKIWKIDLEKDLNTKKYYGVETIQQKLNTNIANRLLNKHGLSDILLIRHIWEHINDQQSFCNSIKLLTHNKSLLVFEIPDCLDSLKNLDYSMIWEEHLYYYTKNSFVNSLKTNGFKIIKFVKYKYPYENVLLAIAQKSIKVNFNVKLKRDNILDNIVYRYINKFEDVKREYHYKLKNISINNTIVIHGVGHLSFSYISYFKIEKYINFYIDDNSHKIGKYLPNGLAKIMSSDLYKNKQNFICLLGMNPNIHQRVKKDLLKFKGIKKIKSLFKIKSI